MPTVPELDALAEEHSVLDYPKDGLKPEKVAALEAAGVELDAEPPRVYRLKLSDKVEGQWARFQMGDRSIELTAENPVFETTNRWEYLGARDLPFLDDQEDDA